MTGPARELVGVLGGMGPAATADFYAKLIRHTPANSDQEHLRVAIWADPTVPDRVGAVLGESTEDPYPALSDGARKLGSLGATLLAMPCHTAHFYRDRLADELGVPIVDMVGETIAELTGHHERSASVGVLGTVATLRSELYQRRLSAAGLRYTLPDEQAQRDVDQAIRSVKAGRPGEGYRWIERAVRSMGSQGAAAVVLACTELPIAFGSAPLEDGPPVVDPTEVLARAVVRECGR